MRDDELKMTAAFSASEPDEVLVTFLCFQLMSDMIWEETCIGHRMNGE
jgi:hypothetical protein